MALAGQPELSPFYLNLLHPPSSLKLLDTMLRLIRTQLARPALTRLLRPALLPTRLILLPPTSSSARRSLSSSPLRRTSDEPFPGAPMSLFNFTEEEIMLRDSGPSLLPYLSCLACLLRFGQADIYHLLASGCLGGRQSSGSQRTSLDRSSGRWTKRK